jgi:hypothetical protein
MRLFIIGCLALIALLGSSCARQIAGKSIDSNQLAEEAHLSAYDRQEEHFRSLYEDLLPRWGDDPRIIEARELASVAEDFYLVAEYETAMEMLQEAVRLLEEKRRLE